VNISEIRNNRQRPSLHTEILQELFTRLTRGVGGFL
jgi:hypothetical protein